MPHTAGWRQRQRAAAYNSPEAKAERRRERREFNAEARDVGEQYRRLRREHKIDEADLVLLDIREANRRALEIRDIPLNLLEQFKSFDALLEVPWEERPIQSFLRKYDNLRKKGDTPRMALADLEKRALAFAAKIGEDEDFAIIVLAREHYTREQFRERIERQRKADLERRRRQAQARRESEAYQLRQAVRRLDARERRIERLERENAALRIANRRL